jgi:hypothetical protein
VRYRKCKNLFDDGDAPVVWRIDDMSAIPFDPTNVDYQQYLAWVAEGNTAEEWSPNASD